MEPTTYFNMDTLEGVDKYREKAVANAMKLGTMFMSKGQLEMPDLPLEALELYGQIAQLSMLPSEGVVLMNYADELLNLFPEIAQSFGCTAIGHKGKISQTLDLPPVELVVAKSGPKRFVTFPPYTNAMGMNDKIAMGINFLYGPVQQGTPVSFMRARVLEMESLDEAVNYLTTVVPTTAANFMLGDGSSVVNVEVGPEGTYVQEQNGKPLVHTNHFLNSEGDPDSVARYVAARGALDDGLDVEDILAQDGIYKPIDPQSTFGSIITVKMNPAQGTFLYKDPHMSEFASLD